ncbi:MAG: hypothetical protein C4K60_15670 [Ideonella sp. MAG2]|nr:MAG: hypothetical protein C4K60_15670 [Ideonella sp. MAG2]
MSSALSSLVSDVVASPLGDVIASVGEGVAAAQRALDEGSLAQTLAIYSEQGDAGLQMLREIGYQPTFYSLPETTGEVTVSLTLGNAASQNGAAPATPGLRGLAPTGGALMASRSRAYVTPVDAGFANRYGYSAQVSAKLNFKIVPVPPPAGTEDLRLMPELTGLALPEARARLSALGLLVAVQGEAPKPEAEATRVVSQTEPTAGMLTRLGATVTLALK